MAEKEMHHITDEYVVSLYFNEDECINPNYLKKEWLEKHADIYDYLTNRYDDSLSTKETLYRILLNIENRPVCKACGNPVRFDASHRFSRNRNGWPFMIYCSAKCQANDPDIREKHRQTNLRNFGVDNPAKSEEVKATTKKTNIERYGVENPWASDDTKSKIKATNTKRYGVDQIFKRKDYVEIRKKSLLDKYNVDSYAKTDEFKNYMKENKDAFMKKQYLTKKKNNSFNISNKEERLHEELSKSFKVIRQYRSSEYPFSCDFYLPELELYIEFNGTWTHGNHLYDPNDKADIERKEVIEDKALSSKYYKVSLYAWTDLDIRKMNTAIENHLNFLMIYPHISLDAVSDFIIKNYRTKTTDKQSVIGEI